MIWRNGEIVSGPGVIDAEDRGFLLGDTVFETIAVNGTVPLFLDRHIRRINASLAALYFDVSISASDIVAGLKKLISASGLDNEPSAVARLTVSRGPGVRGLAMPKHSGHRPDVYLWVRPFERPVGAVTLGVGRVTRSANSLGSRHKTGGYIDNIVARHEAVESGFDDVLMLNDSGRPACASAANIFFCIDEHTIVTPSIDEGALPGITRALLIEAGQALGVQVLQTKVSAETMRTCPAFITNSLIGIRRCAVDGGLRSDHPLLDKVANWHSALVTEYYQANRPG